MGNPAQPPPYTPGPHSASAPTANQGAYTSQPPPYSAHPPGYTPYHPPPPAPGFVPTYGATSVIIQPSIIAIGGCPACRVGVLEDDFTCLGIFCAIFLFPVGILCCLALKNRRCSNCNAYFG